jgi:hypothetical protein
MNKKQWKGIIAFLSIPTVLFAITSIFYSSFACSDGDMLAALKAIEYSLLTWICLIVICICFICWLLEEDLEEERTYLIIDNFKEKHKYTIIDKKGEKKYER